MRRLRSFKDRKDTVTLQLIPFFGQKALTEITAEDVEWYRTQRRKRNGKPASLGTVNNDHIMLKHCLSIAMRKGLVVVNPATLVPIPNAHNERDRVLTAEEWERLYAAAAPHLKPILLTAYQLGQRLGHDVPHAQAMPGLHQVAGHGLAHPADADETDLHWLPPF